MFHCTRTEMKLIMDGKASGVVRKYEGNCPHDVGSQLVFTSDVLDDSGRQIPFCEATIISVRPGTVGQFESDEMIPQMDGFDNGSMWAAHLSVLYGGLKKTDHVFHIRFKIDQIDKMAGLRGDIKKEN